MSNENIAYCGLYCAECPNRKGIIADLARNSRKELYNFTGRYLTIMNFWHV